MTFWKLSKPLFLTLFAAIFGCSAGPGAGRQSVEAGLEGDSTDQAQTSSVTQDTTDTKETEYSTDLIFAGRAFEAGDLEKAWSLTKAAPETAEAHFLLARIATARGDHEEAIRRYHELTDSIEDFEIRRVTELAKALSAAGRYEEAAGQLKVLLDSSNDLSNAQRLELMKKRASWLFRAKRNDESIQVYEQALKSPMNGTSKEYLNLELGRTMLASGNRQRAETILAPLALKANKAATMKKALRILKKAGMTPVWSASERLGRARILMSRRSWDAALSTLKPLQKKGQKAVFEEARWLHAQIQFKRRRHYKEAIAELTPIVKERGTHAEEAQFLIARALSRLDRDPEAIKAYRAFAAKTKRPGRATEARFLAARLEFYLGRHRAALSAFEKLAGKGNKKNKKDILGPERRRDAHFLAGLSALLVGWPRRAEPHLTVASDGTNNYEVLARNRYWSAVARIDSGKKDGPDALRKICADDATAWYALLAARRLNELGQDPGPCRLDGLTPNPKQQPVKSLEELVPLAAFLARAGLYREAAAELRRAEKSKKVESSTRDWIVNYIALDAPHFAVRRASVGLRWSAEPDEWWQLRAAYPAPYADLVQEVEEQQSLPIGLIHSIARKESMFDPQAVSRVGAMGMMQMMPHTYEANRKRAGLPKLPDGDLPGPEQSIRAAGHELAFLFKRFGGSMPLAIMAYNAGPAAVSRWLDRSGDLPIDVYVEKAGFTQTRNYVKRVYKNLVRYRLLAGKPLPQLPRTAARPNRGESVSRTAGKAVVKEK
ncbi:MAG: transglycosylase SLT domain-containing protein [Proteobacteria bacterium]|nr:transglycosylase SLT domain-containing protein [Pseudomonadota bacterium]